MTYEEVMERIEGYKTNLSELLDSLSEEKAMQICYDYRTAIATMNYIPSEDEGKLFILAFMAMPKNHSELVRRLQSDDIVD